MCRHVVGFSVVCLALMAAGCPAWAAGWSLPVDGAAIGLSFGAAYPGGMHRGIDLPAEAGVRVCSPAAGTVTFAGAVPADGGGTCDAVTIQTADGLRISLLPLDGVYVQAGQTVASGEATGRLAASGDDSLEVPHLHLGLRDGDRYIDPSPMLPTADAPSPVAMAPGEMSDVTPGPPTPATGGYVPGPDTAVPVSTGLRELVRPDATEPAVASSGHVASGMPAMAESTVTSADASAGQVMSASAAAMSYPEGSSQAARLMRDSGTAVADQDVRAAAAAGPAAAPVARWTAARRASAGLAVAPGPVDTTLAGLLTAFAGLIPIIVRSKALVHAR